jgi:hypothetical protein
MVLTDDIAPTTVYALQAGPREREIGSRVVNIYILIHELHDFFQFKFI